MACSVRNAKAIAIVLNPHANSGKGLLEWRKIEAELMMRMGACAGDQRHPLCELHNDESKLYRVLVFLKLRFICHLDLLTATPRKIISIDAIPLQNYLLELKMAAIRQLDFDDSLAFLRVRPSRQRRKTFAALRSHLSKEAGDFWARHQYDVENGLMFQGEKIKLSFHRKAFHLRSELYEDSQILARGCLDTWVAMSGVPQARGPGARCGRIVIFSQSEWNTCRWDLLS